MRRGGLLLFALVFIEVGELVLVLVVLLLLVVVGEIVVVIIVELVLVQILVLEVVIEQLVVPFLLILSVLIQVFVVDRAEFVVSRRTLLLEHGPLSRSPAPVAPKVAEISESWRRRAREVEHAPMMHPSRKAAAVYGATLTRQLRISPIPERRTP